VGAGSVTGVDEVRVDPGPIWGIIQGLASYWLVAAALDLGVFDDLAAGRPLTVQGSRAEALLDGLVALGLLDRTTSGTGDGDEPGDGGSGAYRLSTLSEAYLVSDAPRSMAALVRSSPGPVENWMALAETVRGAGPPHPVGADGEFHARLVAATFPTQLAVARAAVAELGETLPPGAAVLDLGAGAAPWAIAMLEADPSATATLVDLPEVIAIARTTAERYGVVDRCTCVEGDYCSVEFPRADLVVLGHVCRAETPERAAALIARAAAAVGPGGRLVITDYFVADDRSGPVQALLMGATMAAATAGGRAYTYSQFRSWLAAAGLDVVDIVRPVPFQEVLIAHRSSTAGGR
jgi:precorrin-6B methylase 2